MTDIRQGGCLCGKTRYSIDVEHGRIGNCHCTICRKHSGAPYETYVSVKAEKFEWVNKPEGRIETGKTSARQFCRDCGTPLSFVSSDETEWASMTVATLDDPSGLIAQYEIFTSSRMDGVPQVAGARQFKRDFK